MKSLVRNTAINIVAFGSVSVIGLALVPVIVQAYGLAGLGLLVVARLFLPAGLLTILDLGLSEATTRQVAGAEGPAAANRFAATGIVLALGIGVVVAAGLAVATPLVAGLMDLAAEEAATFRTLLLWTAAGLVAFFPGHLFESWLKGMERFDLVRLAEVGAALAYAAGTVAVVLAGLPWQAVGYVFLGTTLLRYMALALAALLVARRTGGLRPRTAEARMLLRLGIDFAAAKLMGVTFIQAPPLIIAAAVGPAGVGLYDVLMRLPRFAKVAAGTASAAMLPAAAKLEARGEAETIERIVVHATLFCVALFMPGFVGGMVFAPEILRWWIGAAYADHGLWLAVAFAWPMIWQFYQIGAATVASRAHAVRRLNLVNALQLGVMLAMSLALLPLLSERAFLLGSAVAAILCAPLFIRVFCREYGIAPTRFMAGPSKVLLAGVVPGLLAAPALLEGWIAGPFALVAAFAAWCLVYWLAAYLVAFTAAERAAARLVAAQLLRRRTAPAA